MKQKTIFLVLSALCISASANAAPPQREAGSLTTWTTKVVPLVIVGEGWSQRFVIQNVDERWSAAARINFYTSDGQPWNVTIAGRGTGSVFDIAVPVGRMQILDLTPSFGTQQLGWARMEQYATGQSSADSSGLGDLFAQVVFRKQSPGLPDFMCSMAFAHYAFRKMTAYFDNTGGNYTGMGIVTSYPSVLAAPVTLRITVRNVNGSVVSIKTIQQRPKTLYWMNLAADFPETAGRVGTFEVEPVELYSTTVTGFSMQFAGNGAFTIIAPFED